MNKWSIECDRLDIVKLEYEEYLNIVLDIERWIDRR